MKKIFSIFLVFIILLFSISLPCSADNENVDNYVLNQYVADSLLCVGSDNADVSFVFDSSLENTLISEVIESLSDMSEDSYFSSPVCSFWLNGSELYKIAEIYASYSTLYPEALLTFSGFMFSYNVNRVFYNRVYECNLLSGGTVVQIEDNTLYNVRSTLLDLNKMYDYGVNSFGFLKINPKDSDGKIVKDFSKFVLYDDGVEIKASDAFALYIDGLGEALPAFNETVNANITKSDSFDFAQLTSHLTLIGFVAIISAVLLICVLLFLVISAIRRHRKKRVNESRADDE